MARTEVSTVDIRRLKYFVAVCEHGGLSRAAQAIGIAQPALTRQIKLLEDEIGTLLFTRNGRAALPNNAGALLLDETKRHLDGLEQAVTRLRNHYSVQPRRISLGICPTIAPLFLSPVEEAVQTSCSSAELSVIEAYSGDLQSLLNAGEIDLALTYAPVSRSDQPMVPLLSERLVLAARTIAGEGSVSLEEIAGLRLILPSRIHQLRRIIDAVCDGSGRRLTPALELDSLATVKALVADGTSQFATILPFHSVANESAEGAFEIRFIDDPAMIRTIALIEPPSPARALPAGLAETITRRADELRRTLEAVF